MQYQNVKLPDGVVKVGETPLMNENTVLPAILNKHMSPKGRYGYLVVEKGSLEFLWEDDLENVLTSDSNHPIVITPERYHHVIITGDVEFKVEFYEPKDIEIVISEENAPRPGEKFI